MIQCRATWRVFRPLESSKGKRIFGSCHVAQQGLPLGYKNLYNDTELQFFRKSATWGTAVVVKLTLQTHCKNYLSQLALKFDAQNKQLVQTV